MRSTRVLSVGVSVSFFLTVLAAIPPRAHAAWVNSTSTQFQVGGALTTIVPTNVGTSFTPPPHVVRKAGPRWPSSTARSWPGSMGS